MKVRIDRNLLETTANSKINHKPIKTSVEFDHQIQQKLYNNKAKQKMKVANRSQNRNKVEMF